MAGITRTILKLQFLQAHLATTNWSKFSVSLRCVVALEPDEKRSWLRHACKLRPAKLALGLQPKRRQMKGSKEGL
eukprot:948398-Amphidinium_carterae.1